MIKRMIFHVSLEVEIDVKIDKMLENLKLIEKVKRIDSFSVSYMGNYIKEEK